MSIVLTGWHLDDDGTPRSGKSVFYRAASDAEPNPNAIEVPTTSTNAAGRWQLTVPDGEWDVYLLDGPTVRVWKARTNLPLSFGNAQIAPLGDIALTKIDEGTLDENAIPDGTAANLQDRLTDIVAQLKRMLGGPTGWNWHTTPETTLHLTQTHLAATGGSPSVHGLSTQASFIGESMGGPGPGYHFKWGTTVVGAESVTPTTPVFYLATAAVAFNVPYPTSCVGVFLNSQWWSITASAQGATTAGFTLYLATQIAGQAAGQPVQWLAVGH